MLDWKCGNNVRRARTLLQKYGICNFSLKWLSRPSLPWPQLGKFVGIAYNWMPGMLSWTPKNPSFSPLFASTTVTFQPITPKRLEIGWSDACLQLGIPRPKIDYINTCSYLATYLVKYACEVRAPKNVKISFFNVPPKVSANHFPVSLPF